MNITEVLSKLEIIKNQDETYSNTGRADGTPVQRELTDISVGGQPDKVRLPKNRNNSYS